MSTETDAFLAEVLDKQRAAEQAIHQGNFEPRMALWSQMDPVTLFGAQLSGSGWDEIEPVFRQVASWFTESVESEFEVVAAGASGDLAYTVGYERNRVTVKGVPRTYTLRVTHVYRREEGQWRIVHRHADFPPDPDAPLFPR
ncbi:MAG TPA: nuclear transport factor 2 family protein [Acidimicrobiia bacterium]|nr:nuclear transport factor 2 family protein [Acidimicrobiia bacterium]